MSIAPLLGLDPQLQPQPQPQLGHGNSSQHAPPIPSTSYAPPSRYSSSSSKSHNQHHVFDDSPKSECSAVTFGRSDGGPAREIDESTSHDDACSTGAYAEEPAAEEPRRSSPFDSQWVCSPDFVLHNTPSRKDGISLIQELSMRRKGTNFIRQVVSSLKLKPICKETAYIYFHRFFMLRSLQKHDPCRIGSACIYLACKYEDHPSYKEHMVRIYHLLVHRKDIRKTDEEYAENCERLISDENLLLQVLGFDSLGIRHFQVSIVESSMQKPLEGSKELYANAYKIASEINRLTMLCVEYPSPILACVSIYLAAVYMGICLPVGWTSSVKGATAEDAELVRKIGEEYRERIAKDSDLVKTILRESGFRCPVPPNNANCSPGDNSRGSTPVYNARNDPISQQILTTFSPDSAYSSNSSHSPPENASVSSSYGIQSRSAQAHHPNASHPNSMMNYPPAIHHQSKHSKQPAQLQYHQQQQLAAASYSPTAASRSATIYGHSKPVSSHDGINLSAHNFDMLAVKKAANQGATAGASGQSNTHSNSSLMKPLGGGSNNGGNRGKRSYHYSSSASNLNFAESGRPSNMGQSVHRVEMTAVGAGSDSHRKRTKMDHHSSSNSSSNSSGSSKHRQAASTAGHGNAGTAALSFVRQQPQRYVGSSSNSHHSHSSHGHHHHHGHQQQQQHHPSMPHI